MDAAGLSRRQATLWAMGALVVGAVARPAPLLASQEVPVPSGAWRLTRRLVRGLRDGKSVTVERAWRIAFARQSRGIAVSGEQVAVSVEAPPKLAPLAKIEEERSTQGLFPILLAPDGIIVAVGQNTTQASFEAAVETAMAMLEEEAGDRDGAAQHARYLGKLQLAGSSLLDELPGDLFFPSTTPFREVRQIALPGGGSGEFEVSWTASGQAGSGLLKEARREVITRIGESERRSTESWALDPA